MKIICLSCGHKVDLGDSYDNYSGQVKCVACRATLTVMTETGDLRSVTVAREVASVGPAPAPTADV